MSLMSRLLRLCKADAHGVMDQLEDKGLLLKQYLREMEESLDQKNRQMAALIERLDRLTIHVARRNEEMQQLEPDLNLALAKEKDDIARMLIRRRRSLDAAIRHLKEQKEALSTDKARLAEVLSRQQLQFESLKARADRCWSPAADDCFSQAAHAFPVNTDPLENGDEAVELELLQRKEALQKGDRP